MLKITYPPRRWKLKTENANTKVLEWLNLKIKKKKTISHIKLRWCDRRYVEKIAEHLADTSQDRFYHAPPYPTPSIELKGMQESFLTNIGTQTFTTASLI